MLELWFYYLLCLVVPGGAAVYFGWRTYILGDPNSNGPLCFWAAAALFLFALLYGGKLIDDVYHPDDVIARRR